MDDGARMRVGSDEMSCEELVELVTDYLEEALPEVDRGRFDRHLDACPGCTTYVEQMRETVRVVGRLPRERIPAAALDQLLVAFRGWNA